MYIANTHLIEQKKSIFLKKLLTNKNSSATITHIKGNDEDGLDNTSCRESVFGANRQMYIKVTHHFRAGGPKDHRVGASRSCCVKA